MLTDRMTLGIRMHGLSPQPHSLAEGQTTQDQLKKNKTIKVLLSLGGTIQKLEKDKQGELGRERTRHHPVSFLCFYTALNLCFWEHFFFFPEELRLGWDWSRGWPGLCRLSTGIALGFLISLPPSLFTLPLPHLCCFCCLLSPSAFSPQLYYFASFLFMLTVSN